MTPPLDMLAPTTDYRRPTTGHKLIIDNFAGAGGASEGIRLALGRDPDYAINHSVGALVMHRANHPGTVHLCEDVFHVDPRSVVGPDGRVGLAWFSPDCTHFSAARGSKPVSHRVRGLAWVVIRWVKKLDPEQRPELICLENVREFLTWGPLILKRDSRGRVMRDSKGRELQIPDPKRAGMTFRRWKTTLEHYGYKVEHRILDAADYGAPTHRKRLFLIARRDGKPIVWPEKTHGPQEVCAQHELFDLGRRGNDAGPHRPEGRADAPQDAGTPYGSMELPVPGLRAEDTDRQEQAAVNDPGLAEKAVPGSARHGRRLPYRTAAECIDWSLPCPSIFLTKRQARVAAKQLGLGGLKRPLAKNTMRRIANGVLRYIMRAGKPFIVPTGYGERAGQEPRTHDAEAPLPTVVGEQKHAVVVPLITPVQNASSGGAGHDASKPLNTITAHPKGGGFALSAAHLVQVNHADGQPREQSLDQPLPTISSKHGYAKVVAFLAKHFGGVVGQPIDKPQPTTTARGTQNQIVAANIVKLRGTCKDGQSVDQPAPTISAQGNHVAAVRAFLVKYYGTGGSKSVNEPLDTITAKERMGLVTIEGEDWQIIDIGMRMLTPRELARCQGFDDSYVFTDKTKSDQVARIGNSVPPPIAAAIVRANYSEIAPVVSDRQGVEP